ncbi:MAG: HIT domain-containing protein [Candidatus Nomurabacteria bacterium]
MNYREFLQTHTTCPFCEPIINRNIQEEYKAYLTFAIAPYHKHHLLVVSKRHIENFEELEPEEIDSVNRLLHAGVKIIKSLGYKNYTILLRNGDDHSKSIRHLHYHIIPVSMIGDLNHEGGERLVMTEEEIEQLLDEIKSL